MSENRTQRVTACLTPDDRAWLDREAEKRGLDASAFIRMTLRREREREASGQQVAVA